MNTYIKPDNKKYYPVSCRKSHGVDVSENFRTIAFKRGDGESYVVFDMGEKSVGGYPVFKVKSYCGNPRLRISYSDRYSVMQEVPSMRKGDFVRGCCKYLGVELPVLPANPGRFEEYSITREGLYVFPLIQGQERFIALELTGADCEAVIEDFYIHGTSA
ncbi:MAG: hypothetical protein K2N18_03050, partial [Clostridia bacterium]|nr:hypothetical protein [Clostridia bacterium]